MRRLALLLLLPALPALADDAVVGNGTPAGCTEAAFDAALGRLYPGANFPGGTITFDCGSAPATIALTTQKGIGFGSGTSIDGGGRVTLDAGGRTRHFYITGAESRIDIANLALTGGRADVGGALLIDPDTFVTLRGVSLVDNEATDAGGAIFAHTRAALAIDACEVRSNQAPQGGAAAINGPLTVTDSRFALNLATVSEGGALQVYGSAARIERSRFDFNGAHDGGAILQRGGTLAVIDSSFEENQATALGGALHVATNTVAVLKRVTARANTAATGGAVFAHNDDASPFGSLAVSGGTYEDNAANEGGAIACFNRGSRNEALNPCPWSEATFSRNVASARGGAILLVGHGFGRRVALRSNRARDGGGLWMQGTAGIAASVFEGNAATMSGGGVMAVRSFFGFDTGNRFAGNSAPFGGGLRVSGGLGYINGSLFEQNQAGFQGGGLFAHGNNEFGPVFITVTHTTFRNNTGTGSGRGGDIALGGGDGLRAEISLRYSTLLDSTAFEGASLYSSFGGEIRPANNLIFPLAGTTCGTSDGGTLVSEGANVTRISNCGFNGPDDLSVASRASLQLLPFGDYGGMTPGFLPQPGSVVLDRALCGGDPVDRMDQRALPRPVDGDGDGFALCDSGAMERQAVESPPSTLPFRDGFEG